MAYAPQHANHIVQAYPGDGTGDTVVVYGDGRKRYLVLQWASPNCNCTTLPGCYPPRVASISISAVTKTTEDIEAEARAKMRAERKREEQERMARRQLSRMRDVVRMFVRPEFHARSNPRNR